MATACCKCCCENHEQDDRFAKLDKLIEEYKGKKGALIPVLHSAQEMFGFLSEEVQRRIAGGLGVPLSDVYGVVTFYSFFTLEPKGEHTIGVCLGTACYVKGAQDVLDELKKQLKVDVNSTTNDNRFTLGVTRCVGACGLAPVVTIDDDVYGRMTPDKVKDILAKYE